MDLYNNPMINAAKKALSPEQMEEYKRIGNYMYNNTNYNTLETTPKINKPTSQELCMYALEFIKAGGEPVNLSEEELNALVQIKGKKWYEEFGFEEKDIPKPMIELLDSKEGLEIVESQLKNLKITRQERRAIERKLEKQKNKIKK